MATENASTELARQNQGLRPFIANIANSNEKSMSFKIRTASSIRFSKQFSLDLKWKQPRYSSESEKERIVSL